MFEKILGFIKATGRVMGRPFAKHALTLLNVLQNRDIPASVRMEIIGALTYLVVPTDLVPDQIPFLGFVDDEAALAAVYYNLMVYVDADIRKKTESQLEKIFN